MVGYTKPDNKIIVTGVPLVQELRIETVANMYPGRLVVKGSLDADIVAASAPTAGNSVPVIGILGYEQAHDDIKPLTVDTIYKITDFVPVLSGSIVVVGSSVTAAVNKGDYLVPAADGKVALMPTDAAMTEPPTKAETELALAMVKSVIAVAEETIAVAGDIIMRMIR